MEAILARAPGRQLETAALAWLDATRRLARVLLAAAADVLVQYSRAGLLLKAGSRRLRRL